MDALTSKSLLVILSTIKSTDLLDRARRDIGTGAGSKILASRSIGRPLDRLMLSNPQGDRSKAFEDATAALKAFRWSDVVG